MDPDILGEPSGSIEISITAPSAAPSEDEEEFIPRVSRNFNSNATNGNSTDNSKEEGRNNGAEASKDEDELSNGVESELSLSEGGDSKIEGGENVELEEKDSRQEDEKPANLEMIGDRVLIERDGKFELVDVSEIKAEYFEMLGINPEQKDKKIENDDENDVANDTTGDEKSPKAAREEKKATVKMRPKTTNVHEMQRRRNTRNSVSPEKRSASAKVRSSSEDYSHIKSIYGMTEEQIKIKRRREEAIAKRKKEEKEREEEEMRRKREDAETAFQAWLTAKLEEAKERKIQEEKNKPDSSLHERKLSEAHQAYEEWLVTKKQQDKISKEYEDRRRSEEASQFVIRDRQLCDEAFKRWLRNKRADAKAKETAKKKRKKSKPKPKKKESLPLNSKNITYLEYYGYRNPVVL